MAKAKQKEKIGNYDYLKIKAVCLEKETTDKVDWQKIEWKKYLQYRKPM